MTITVTGSNVADIIAQLAVSGAPVPAPSPAPSPGPTPAPGPSPSPTPTPSGMSPDGTAIVATDGKHIVTVNGTFSFGAATYLGGNALLINGAQTGTGFGDMMLVSNGGKVYSHSKNDGSWWEWRPDWNKWNGETGGPAPLDAQSALAYLAAHR